MSWREWFRSRHVVWLEAENKKLQERLDSELRYHREELKRLQDELERTRLYLVPTMQSIVLPSERDKTPAEHEEVDPLAGLTPFQRLVARSLAEQDAELERKKKSGETVKKEN
jgi:hypothetical protein